MVEAAELREGELLAALRAGDERAFVALVERHHASMVRIALLFVPSREVAEEVAQEAWLGVLKGLDRFEGRSSLKTWIFRILTNTAKTRGVREGRSVPFSALGESETSVDPDLFLGPDHEQFPGHWASPPSGWPEHRLLAGETRERLRQAIDTLPPNQRAVISLRDVEGWSSEDVCNALELTETNQRVLLHRARAKVRRALEEYLGEDRT
jgi:RNA polymerase sigma-70 factor, ECF subfamily